MKNNLKKIAYVCFCVATMISCKSRVSDPPAPTGPTSIASIIIKNEVAWNNDKVTDPTKPDYLVDGIVSIQSGGILVINEGTYLSMSESSSIVVEQGGILQVKGSGDTQILGTGDTWGTITVKNGGEASLRGARIEEGGGTAGTAAVVVEPSGTITVENMSMSNSGGVSLGDGSIVKSFKTNKFSGLRGSPLTLPFTYMAKIAADNALGNNHKSNVIVLKNGATTAGNTYAITAATGLPYSVPDNLTVNDSKISFGAKTEAQFGTSAGITLNGTGTIDASESTFKGQTAGSKWGGITIAGEGSSILNTLIDGGGIVLNGNNATLRLLATTLQNAPGYALDVKTAKNLSIEGTNTIQNSGKTSSIAPVRIPFGLVSKIATNSLKVTNNGRDAVEVLAPGTANTGDVTMNNTGVPFQMTGNTVLGGTATLTVGQGVELQFETSNGKDEQFTIKDGAKLNAVGGANAKIKMTCIDATKTWSGLFVRTQKANNGIVNLDQVIIEKGGGIKPTCSNTAVNTLLTSLGGTNLFVDQFISGRVTTSANLTLKNTAMNNATVGCILPNDVYYGAVYSTTGSGFSNGITYTGNKTSVYPY